MSPLKVGIIDSGIDIENSSLMKYARKTVNIENSREVNDEIGHGTAIADLITRELEPDELELYIYKLFNKELNVDIKDFAKILELAIGDGIHIINCSLGTIDPSAKYELENIIREACDKGIIIISAWNDENYTTWPANFEGVISVKSGNQKSQTEWNWEKNKHSHFIFRGTEQRVRWKDKSQLFIGGSSFAAALCTRQISNEIIKNNLSLNFREIEKYLEDNAVEKIEINLERSPLIHWNKFHTKMKRVGLYPFFKEMHGFVRFRKNLNYEISWIADFSKSKNAAKNTKEILANCNEDIYINNGLPEDHDNVDTLILGYLDKASEAMQKDLLTEALNYALKKNLNVFSFLPPDNFDEWKRSFINNGNWLEVPYINYNYALDVLQKVPEKKAFDTPILGVFGTSSQQGKFTLQLALRYELQKRGFKVAQIGTEHQSGCFGVDFTFPIGYGLEKSVTVPLDFYIPFLRRVISELDNEGYDTIIVGAQSGLLSPNPYYYGNLFSRIFYTGTIPDRSILIYNESDDKTLVDNCSDFIKSISSQNVFYKVSFDEIRNEGVNNLATEIVNILMKE